MERGEREEKRWVVWLVDGSVGGLKVLLRAFLLHGSRRKAVAERHALPSGVLGDSVFLLGSDVISLDYNYKLSLYNNYILDI